jgi:ornithine carbamoyltransferase
MNAPRHYLQFKDFSRAEYDYLFDRTRWIKDRFKRYEPHHPLFDRTLVMIFEKASTRTRLSFEAGMQQLGGSAIYLNTRDSQLGRGEPVEDAAQVISRMSDIVMIRTFEQTIIERFAEYSRVPVINGLTNEYHPCQILADIFTFIEHRGPIQGKTVAWVGTRTTCATPGCRRPNCLISRCMSTPPGYEVEPEQAVAPNGSLRPFRRPHGGLPRCRSRDHRRVDQHGFRGRERRAHARFRRLAGGRT